VIRVDHAGEYGAKRIYQGQLAVLRGTKHEDTIRHMQEQEQVHLDTFSGHIAGARVRPTALLPIWHVAGFALGAVTAAHGARAAMACTVAVEERSTSTTPPRKRARRGRGAAEGRDRPLPRRGAGAPRHRPRQRGGADAGYRLLSAAIKLGCKAAIRVSEKV
jgi:ubiquinone biosynthesis monooxygenase Coq7